MPSYVIATPNEEYLDTPVFHAGPDLNDEAVAVFTRRSLAEQYIADAGWSDHEVVESLSAINLLRWLVHADEERARFLTIDPDHASQEAGEPQSVIIIEQQLAGIAELLTQNIIATRQKGNFNVYPADPTQSTDRRRRPSTTD